MELADMLDHLRWLKARRDRSTKVSKERDRIFKEYERDVYHYLERNRLDGVKSDGYTFGTRSTTMGNVFDQDAFEAWLHDNDLMEDYLRSEPQKARLNELVRERLDNKQDLPPGVSAHAREYISITEQ